MNNNQLISNEEALRLFFNDDVYLVQEITPIKIEEKVESVENSPNEKTQIIDIVEPIEKTTVISVPQTVAEPTVNYPETTKFKHLGKNEQGILILVDDSQNPVSTVPGVELLRKLLLSINLKTADFALVNYAQYNTVKFDELNKFFSCKMVISFGVTTAMLDLETQNLHEVKDVDGVKMIFTHNLDHLETDVASKRILWGTLKNI